MKHTVRILLLTLVLALSLLALVSCGEGAHTHAYGQPATVPASCWQDGYKTYACLLCGEEKVVTLKATGVHSFTSGDVVYTEEAEVISSHKRCVICGALSAPIHTYGKGWEGDETNHWHEPTCDCPWLSPYGTAAHSFASGAMIYVYHTEDGVTTSITSHYACDICGKPGETLHTYAGAWSSDAEGHRHEPTCGCEGLLPLDAGAHDYASGKLAYTEEGGLIVSRPECDVCGAHGAPLHTYAGAWSSDAEGHWHEPLCGCEGLLPLDAGAHDYASGKLAYLEEGGLIVSRPECDVCGAYGAPLHTYAVAWSSDAATHWHAPTCGCPDLLPYGTGVHDYTSGKFVYAEEGGGLIISRPECDVCGAVGDPLHIYSAILSSDAESHWHAPLCGCAGLLPYGTAAHSGPADSYTVNGEDIIAHKTCEVCGASFTETVEDAVVVTDTASAQLALDTAGEDTLIYFKSADYGKLYLRTVKEASERYTLGARSIYHRTVSGLTLLAEEGATFVSLAVETRAYPNADATHSLYPSESFFSVISLYDLSLLGLTFTGEETALHLEGYYEIDGLTLDGCTIRRETPLGDDKPWLILCKTDADTLSMGGETFVSSRRNITVRNCTVEGIHQAVELRGTENVTLVNNTVTNIAERCFLFSTTSTPYTGTITVSGNTVSGLGDRFFRATRITGARLILTDNAVTGYTGTDADIVKVTESTVSELVFENNDLPDGKTVTLPEAE